MALNLQTILSIAFEAATTAQSATLTTYSAATLTVLAVRHFPCSLKEKDGTPYTEARLRRAMAASAVQAGINADSWATNVNGVFKAADKLAAHARGAEAGAAFDNFDALPDLTDAEAVAKVQSWFIGLGVLAPKHLLAWSKQTGFGKYDPAAAKAARVEAKLTDEIAALMMGRTDPKIAPVAGAASDGAAAPVSGLDTVLAAIGTMNHADALTALSALNDRMAALQAIVDAAPAPDAVAPVLSDDATVHPLSSLGKVSRKRTAKAA